MQLWMSALWEILGSEPGARQGGLRSHLGCSNTSILPAKPRNKSLEGHKKKIVICVKPGQSGNFFASK